MSMVAGYGPAKLRLVEVIDDPGGAMPASDQPEIKELVSVIMEGSVEVFRLRRERHGY